ILLLRCSFPAVSISKSMSFWPSTIATRSSSAWVALNNMRFIFVLPRSHIHGEDKPGGRPGCRGALAFCRREIHWVEEDERFWPEVCQYTSCFTQEGGIHFWCASAQFINYHRYFFG